MNISDISNLLDGLSAEDLSALSDTAQQLFGSTQAEEPAPDFTGGIDPAVLAKIMQVMPLLTSPAEDDRTRLICALKPLLSQPRRRKADEAMQLIKLIEILPMLGSL